MVKKGSLQVLTGARGARTQNGPKMQISVDSDAKIVEKTIVLLVREAKILVPKYAIFPVLP